MNKAYLHYFRVCIKICRCVKYVICKISMECENWIFLCLFSGLFFFLIVFYNQEGERLEQISESDRNVIYTKRTNQIQKVCKKYGLTVENVTKSSKKKNVPPETHYNQLQSNYTGQSSDKVDIFYQTSYYFHLFMYLLIIFSEWSILWSR